MHTLGPNGRGLLAWLLDNLPALAAALSAAGAVLIAYKRRNFWVYLYAFAAFVYTFFQNLNSKEYAADQDWSQQGGPDQGR